MKAVCLALAAALLWPGGSARAEPSTPASTVTAELPAQRPPLDLNRASEAELLELPGVGPSRARAILAFREAHGGFSSVSQLLRIKGFGRATLRRLRPLLTVSPPSAPGPTAQAAVR